MIVQFELVCLDSLYVKQHINSTIVIDSEFTIFYFDGGVWIWKSFNVSNQYSNLYQTKYK